MAGAFASVHANAANISPSCASLVRHSTSRACSCSTTSGGVLEGTVALPTVLAVADASLVPGSFAFSVVPVETGFNGSLLPSSQTPVCNGACDTNIQADETVKKHRARFLVGRVH